MPDSAAACGLRPFLPAAARRRARVFRRARRPLHGTIPSTSCNRTGGCWPSLSRWSSPTRCSCCSASRAGGAGRRALAPTAARGGARRARLRRGRAAVRRHARRARRRLVAWPGRAAWRSSRWPERAVLPVFARARARLADGAARRGADGLPRRRVAAAGGARRAAATRSATSRSRCSSGLRCGGRRRGEEKYAGLRILRR